MHSSLPRRPSVDHLRKQAKMLLAAQRHGNVGSCRLLRSLHRFLSSDDEEILHSKVTLAEAQLALALQYGYGSWQELVREARSYPVQTEVSLERVCAESEVPIPVYAGAGVPTAIVAGLNHAGVPIKFMEFAAATGWSFSFSYCYNDISAAFMAIRGKPGDDGPLEVFAFLPGLFGLGYEMARTEDADALWGFVTTRVDAGTPVMSEHMDGGLITGYRTKRARREIFFEGTVDTGWTAADGLGPYAVYSFVRERDPRPREEVIRLALIRAIQKGRAHTWNGQPQGLLALRAYLADVRDPGRTFEASGEWFCWATFERLMARRCSEVWLRTLAQELPAGVAPRLEEAAGHYETAFRNYDLYRGATQGSEPPRPTLHERARSPERIAQCAPLLEQGIESEARGVEVLEEAVRVL